MMVSRRVKPNVGEIEIEADKDSRFDLSRIEDFWIRFPSQSLGERRVDVVSGVAK